MSKKGCLIISVVIIIIFIILITCGALCILTSEVFSNYDLSSISSSSYDTISEGGEDKIVIIKVEGLIMDVDSDSSLFGSSYASSQSICRDIDSAIEDEDVRAIILSIDSPGGDVYATDVVYKKILEAQSYGIMIVALFRNTAASGGYYIAAPADQIVSSPLSLTGSIGVRLDVQSLSGLYEKLGIETRTITNQEGEYKTGEGLFDDDPNGEEDEIYKKLVDEYFNQFLTVVADGREIEESELLQYADGRIFSGQQAYEIGLVDTLGDMDDAISAAESLAGIENPTVIEYREYDFWSMFAGYAAGIFSPSVDLSNLVDPTPGVKLRYLYVE